MQYIVEELFGNYSYIIGVFDEENEAKDFLLNDCIKNHTDSILKDNPEMDYEEARELASSYYHFYKEPKEKENS
jgi:hypothetical protein